MKWLLLSLSNIFAILALTLVSGCSYDKKEIPVKALPDSVFYSIYMQPMFNSSCAVSGCHTGGTPSAGLNLSDSVSYNSLYTKHEINLLSPTKSNLYLFMNSNMPPSGKIAWDVDLTLKWIEQGAKNN